ncbi:SWIM zinc finger family protein, partial [Thermoflexus sp.]|uniref:SWIM zinc finger family protein n=1 Tax=Thermoflexus sp. TaxID=1969742 RepID=UPI002ADD8368
QVANGERTYMVRYDGDRWACECPDFLNRGFRCKHLFAAFLAQRSGLVTRSNQTQPAPQAQPAPEPPPPPAPAPEAPQGAVVPFGRHKGKPLAEAAREDPDLLFWIIRKMEVRTDRDRLLKEEARALAETIVKEKASQASPDDIVVPFGEEKGKPLSRCHPKWVSILARKGIEDAFSLQDAVTYEVARLIKAKLDQKRGEKARSGSLGDLRDVLREALREAILQALQEAQKAVWDREAILAELSRMRERLDRLERRTSAADAAIALREAR